MQAFPVIQEVKLLTWTPANVYRLRYSPRLWGSWFDRMEAYIEADSAADTLRLSISTAYHFRPKDDIGVAFWIMTHWQDLMCLTVGHNEETRRRLLAVALAAQRPGWRALFKHNPKHTQTK